MSQLDLSGCRKRKRGERVFKFKVFGERGYPAELERGSFEENVRGLLEFGQLVESGMMLSWSFQLEVRRHPLLYLFLFVVEEPIEMSLQLPCNHCHYIGWGNYMTCNKKYHFLLPSKACSGEYCKSNIIDIQGDDHSLHGVFHSNGFGHLLCINGLETGSDLPGYQIMDFWDRLCSGLGARKVSLKDVSKKKGMDLRLLHTVAYGKPWFGRWDYTFGRGTYGVTQEIQQSAVKAIQNIPLDLIAHQLHDIQTILSRYQVLSGHSLVTLGDLFHFMLELKSRIPTESISIDSNYPGIMSDTSCRWSPKRVEMAIHVVIEALKRAEFHWVSRQHVRDVARAHIGDTGLLDFVLKSLGNHVVGKYFVRRCLNPVTKVLEYCLEETSPPIEAKLKPQQKISRAQLMKDIYYTYKNILIEQDVITKASRIILHSKYLIKDFCPEIDEKNKCKIYCTVILANEPDATPYHCFMLRSNAIFDELRCEVEKTFRETYFGLRNFVVESIRNMNPTGTDLVFKMVKPGSKIAFQGRQVGLYGGIYEGLMAVDCICGTKNDDGERMVSCDICQVWQHTRCVQIPDNHEIPNIFLCNTCEQDILHFPSLP
ncbi:PHD Zn-finger protein [Handroanthus impetiginosus]|uniref:PHD Zn-finger protein n=1 Tax=Handroanthus impetiginosus TaxID=429701 RepID=A0A2G9HBP3_9LAMI|nr:PHD Zn-finger protein [Handroanthus impetiginosus]